MATKVMNESPAIIFQRKRWTKNRFADRSMGLLTVFAILLVPLITSILLIRAWPIIATKPIGDLIFSTTWHPMKEAFGFFPFIMGTLWVTALAMIISVPPSLLTAIFLAEYAPARTRSLVKSFIDILAGIPSVVFGIWGVMIIVPFVRDYIAPILDLWLGFVPLFRNNNPTGYGLLAGGLVLAVMVFPIIISLADEVISAVPQGLREASLTLGATRWQTIKGVVIRYAWSGVIAAVMLGFSRAFGETMAVMMVVGNVPQIPSSIFDPAYPLTALIANNYGEMMSIPLYDSALMVGALILLIIILIFNLASRLALVRLIRRE
jgi:phosphate transport system permease protein